MKATLRSGLVVLACLRLSAAAAERPNLLLILADDLGWSDLGCYGGEIRTPALDALAAGGVSFTQFYNSSRCCPSRAAILTGLHPHQAGFPLMSGTLQPHTATIAEALRPAGYGRYMTGKWHLGAKRTPVDCGFEEFYGMVGGFNTCWEEQPHYSRLPAGRTKREYAPGGFYSTDVFGDYAVEFLDQGRARNAPWFLYLAFNAPHFPLHAPEEEIAKYEALYADGWDRIRERRLARQKDLGLVPRDLALTPRSVVPANWANEKTGWADKDNPAWDTIPADRRADLARRMAVFAAMVDRMDQCIARVVAHLKATGQFENSLVVFLSDNGACAEWDPWGFDGKSGPDNVLHTGADLKTIGAPASYVSYGSGWANACNTPWRLYKHYGHEGGIRTPFIVHWPAGLGRAKGRLVTSPGHITDILPTLLDAAGAEFPTTRDGVALLPPEGVSLLPVLRGGAAPERAVCMEHEGHRSIREGDWKLVAIESRPWELYDMARDPVEMHNLAAAQPDRVARMAATWEAWAKRCGVKGHEAREGRGEKAADTKGPAAPRIAGKALRIACEVGPQSRDGVILAHGGNRHGYALHLRGGNLIFTVRVNGEAQAITADKTPAGKLAIEARLAKDGAMTLSVNGRAAASGRAAGLIPEQPMDGLTVGEDEKSAVGDYAPPFPLKGVVRGVSVKAE
jgi:arylsulfatase